MKRYRTIYADPPWPERGGGKIKRGADRHYPLMTVAAIMRLEIDGNRIKWLAEDDAHLYLWTTNNYLPDALRVAENWGFEYKTLITWPKPHFGLGQYFRGQTEHCIFAVRGNIPYRKTEDGKRAQGRTLLESWQGKHSQKPELMRQWIERVSPGPYIEIFARQATNGWDSWGDEMESRAPETPP